MNTQPLRSREGIAEAIEVMQKEKLCVARKVKTNCTNCDTCDLVLPDKTVSDAIDLAIEVLKEAHDQLVEADEPYLPVLVDVQDLIDEADYAQLEKQYQKDTALLSEESKENGCIYLYKSKKMGIAFSFRRMKHAQQLPWFMMWKEWYDGDGDIEFTKVLIST